MANNKINFAADVLLPLVSIAVTLTLFYLFRSENATALFDVNMGYTVFLEIIFFGYLNLVNRKSRALSTVFYAVFGVSAFYYVIIGLGWMGIYSMLLTGVLPLKFYVSGIVVLTLLWVIVSVLLMRVDGDYKEEISRLDSQRHSLEFYAGKMNLLASRYAGICDEKNVLYQTQSNNRTILERLNMKIKFLTPNLCENETAMARLNAILDKCGEMIDEAEAATGEELTEVTKKIQRFVNDSVMELDMLKNLARK